MNITKYYEPIFAIIYLEVTEEILYIYFEYSFFSALQVSILILNLKLKDKFVIAWFSIKIFLVILVAGITFLEQSEFNKCAKFFNKFVGLFFSDSNILLVQYTFAIIGQANKKFSSHHKTFNAESLLYSFAHLIWLH